MWQRKKDRDGRCFGDHVVRCFNTAEASIYADNKRNIVLQHCFCAVVIGEYKLKYQMNLVLYI